MSIYTYFKPFTSVWVWLWVCVFILTFFFLTFLQSTDYSFPLTGNHWQSCQKTQSKSSPVSNRTDSVDLLTAVEIKLQACGYFWTAHTEHIACRPNHFPVIQEFISSRWGDSKVWSFWAVTTDLFHISDSIHLSHRGPEAEDPCCNIQMNTVMPT